TAATAAAGGHGTVIPWYVVFPLLGLALAAAAIDWFRRRPDDPGGPDEYGATGPAGPDGSDGKGKAEPPPAPSRGEVLAIVPCYNEAGNVGGVVDELRQHAPFLDILVVDDGSTDETALEARRAGAFVVSHMENGGIGATVRTGMSYALEAGYKYAVQVDGDGQHDPRYIASMIESLESGPADVVVGSRFLGTGDYKPPLARAIGIKLLAWVVSLVSGRKATDTTSGFRAMNRRAMRFLVANYPDDYPESESLVLMERAGIRWAESPVEMRARRNGVSSIRGLGSATYMAKVLGCIAMDSLGLKTPHSP
ncbi:MAG: glycosyltransferase family 2 protein, partial [Candidatus Geothermincolia bacterium]